MVIRELTPYDPYLTDLTMIQSIFIEKLIFWMDQNKDGYG